MSGKMVAGVWIASSGQTDGPAKVNGAAALAWPGSMAHVTNHKAAVTRVRKVLLSMIIDLAVLSVLRPPISGGAPSTGLSERTTQSSMAASFIIGPRRDSPWR